MRRSLAVTSMLALAACLDFDKKVGDLCDAGRFDCGGRGDGGGPFSNEGLVFTRGVCLSGWCYENPFPHGLLINSIWASGPGDVWVLSQSNLALHWDGGSWQALTPAVPAMQGPIAELKAMWGFGPDDLWLLADGEAPFRRRAGGPWVSQPGFQNNRAFRSITGSSDGGVWLGSTELVSWRDGVFTDTVAPPGFEVVSLSAQDDRECWAVLRDDNPPGRYLRYRCDGTETYDAGPDNAVWGRAGEHWFGGPNGVTRLDDAGLGAPMAVGISEVRSGTMIPGTADWVAAGSSCRVRRGSGTSTLEAVPADVCDGRDLTTVWANGPNDIWVGGTGGALAHSESDGGFRSLHGPSIPNLPVFGLAIGPALQVAASDRGMLQRTPDGTWRPVPGSLGPLRAATAAGDGTVVGVGNNVIEVFDGGAVQRMTPSANLFGVWAAAPTDIWAVGSEVWHKSGGTWSQLAGPVGAGADDSYWKVSGSTKLGVVWAVARLGTTGVAVQLFRDGGSAIEAPDLGIKDLFAVAVAEDTGNVYVAGDPGVVRVRVDGGWQPMPLGAAPTPLYDVFIYDETDVWAVGEAGVVLRGGLASAWQQVPPVQADISLQAVRRTGDDVYVCANRGVILHAHLPLP